MKITLRQLRRLIREVIEEANEELNEIDPALLKGAGKGWAINFWEEGKEGKEGNEGNEDDEDNTILKATATNNASPDETDAEKLRKLTNT